MIYLHKKSNKEYRFLLEYWDVERQALFLFIDFGEVAKKFFIGVTF